MFVVYNVYNMISMLFALNSYQLFAAFVVSWIYFISKEKNVVLCAKRSEGLLSTFTLGGSIYYLNEYFVD